MKIKHKSYPKAENSGDGDIREKHTAITDDIKSGVINCKLIFLTV